VRWNTLEHFPPTLKFSHGTSVIINLWDKVLVAFSVLPIALVKNRIRIVLPALVLALEFVLPMSPASGANFTGDAQAAKKFRTHEIVLSGNGLALNGRISEIERSTLERSDLMMVW